MVSFFRRLFRSKAPAPDELRLLQLPSDDRFPLQVVGESHYQGQFEVITGGRQEDGVQRLVTVHLVLDDDNPYDRNAVKVLVGGMHVGHLSKPDAVAYRQYLQTNRAGRVIGVCNGQIRGGWDRGGGDAGSFGIWLDFPLYG